MNPRVTLGIATYERDDYLRDAVQSALTQDYSSMEVLVVLDGTTNPRSHAVLDEFAADPRLRVIRHPENRGIAAAYDTFVSEGRGELIAMVGDDDLCLPRRISRQVAVFDREPDTGIVHGDAEIIDARGAIVGAWNAVEQSPGALVKTLFRDHNYLIDPTRMVHRRVYERIGGYDGRLRLAQDLDFWLRAAREFRFRHVGGAPLIRLRRHGDNGSDESLRELEVSDVTQALGDALERYSLRELVPELDWAILDPTLAERQALLRLAGHVERRALPLPSLGARLRRRADALPASPGSSPATGRRLMMTMFGWEDSGGGTTIPRLAAKELARRGWDVTVFHASTQPTASGLAYDVSESVCDGVRLIGVHNRPSLVFDAAHPHREIDDPAVRAAFAAALDRVAPDVVHFHNLHNLGASLMDETASRGLPAYFTTHNYWLICPRAYLVTETGEMCPGPGDGSACASCTGRSDPRAYARRLSEIRDRAHRGLRTILAVSDAVRNTLVASGFDPDLIDVVRQATPHEDEIHAAVGARRAPGRRRDVLTIAFLGSASEHKGPQLLVAAAQRCAANVRVRILGETSPAFAKRLRALDARGVVELWGGFEPTEIAGLLADVDAAALPSTWWDCAPLAATECRAAGVAVLVPRLGGLPEAVVHDVDGLVFDGLDVDDLARAIDRLDAEPGLLERLQAAPSRPRSFAQYVDELEARYGGERPQRPQPRAHAELAVRWQGDHDRSTSLSIVNSRITERLPGHVERIARDGSTRHGAPLPFAADVEVRHQWPPDFSAPRAGRLALIQPWEFGAIPRDWVEPIQDRVDELWVPSEYVRGMYLEAGIDPERVVVIPNGVDLTQLSPDGPRRELAHDGLHFLFVGGLLSRKGPDVLLAAWRRAFAGRDDVTLVVKDYGATSVYPDGDREPILAHAASRDLPRIEVIDEDLSASEIAALYRACDVLVAPYRGEGFCMPVLEAMACGLPVITTAGGPTDEFAPTEAGWRIRSHRLTFPHERLENFETIGHPWMLEPDRDHLVALLREAAADDDGRRARGRAAMRAATALSWDTVADRYAQRIAVLAARPRRRAPVDPHPLDAAIHPRVMATPAWRGRDRLDDLLAAWAQLTTPDDDACLYLVANPEVDGSEQELQTRVLDAAARHGVDLDVCADVEILCVAVRARRDERLHAAMDAYVPLHPACDGHVRLARAHSCEVVDVEALATVVGQPVATA